MVTGHGWSATQDQCGEFCEAIYHLLFNGRSAYNVSQFRNDCVENPNGEEQRGTWPTARNGWCPGSVSQGLHIDVTDHVAAGSNTLAIDLNVLSGDTGEYQKYTDYMGFVNKDKARMAVGLTFFVYGDKAVEAILAQSNWTSAAERAIWEGSNDAKAIEWPRPQYEEEWSYDGFRQVGGARPHLLAKQGQGSKRRSRRPRINPIAEDGTPALPSELPPRRERRPSLAPPKGVDMLVSKAPRRFAPEATAPWYDYSTDYDGPLERSFPGATRIPIFSKLLVQRETRHVTLDVKLRDLLPAWEWEQAVLHFRLEKPDDDHLELDNWDRLGSFGVLVGPDTDRTSIHPEKVNVRGTHFDVMKVPLAELIKTSPRDYPASLGGSAAPGQSIRPWSRTS